MLSGAGAINSESVILTVKTQLSSNSRYEPSVSCVDRGVKIHFVFLCSVLVRFVCFHLMIYDGFGLQRRENYVIRLPLCYI